MQKIFENIIASVVERKNTLSTVEFARIIGMPQQTVDLYLKGERKPSVEFIFKFCSAFGVSADAVLGLQPRQQLQKGEWQIPSRLTDRLDEIKHNAERATESINALQGAIEKLGKII